MRAFAVLTLTAAGLAALVTAAPAAELDLPNNGCARGQYWNGYRCDYARPRVAETQPTYRAPPVYQEDDEEEYVAEAPPGYAAPPVYSYAVPYYTAPAYGYYAYAGPRYGYRLGWNGGHHRRWRH